jgi:hypothetical protein
LLHGCSGRTESSFQPPARLRAPLLL